jgi:hypothetical protein
MRRSATIVVLALGSLLAAALPAQAKGVTSATFTGPGLPPGGLTIDTDDGHGGARPDGHTLMEGVAPLFESYKLDTPPVLKSDLGPKYQAVVAFDFAPKPLRMVLYPYAEGGPVIFTAPRQKLGPEFEVPTLESGWTSTDTTFLDTLVSLGFPETAPAAVVSAPRAQAVAQPAPENGRWRMPVTVGAALAALLAGTLLLLRSRRREQRA